MHPFLRVCLRGSVYSYPTNRFRYVNTRIRNWTPCIDNENALNNKVGNTWKAIEAEHQHRQMKKKILEKSNQYLSEGGAALPFPTLWCFRGLDCCGAANPTYVMFLHTVFLKQRAVARLLGALHYHASRLRHVCHLYNTCLLVQSRFTLSAHSTGTLNSTISL